MRADELDNVAFGDFRFRANGAAAIQCGKPDPTPAAIDSDIQLQRGIPVQFQRFIPKTVLTSRTRDINGKDAFVVSDIGCVKSLPRLFQNLLNFRFSDF